MTYIIQLLETTLNKVLLAFAHNWIYLVASILIGSLIKLFLDKDRVAAYLRKHQKGGVALATVVAVGTPLCSCGTTAIVIGMMASMMPWAPIVAFMVASPLSSPEGMFYTAGLFGWPFALAAFIASILLGLAGGLIAGLLDKSGWLKNQGRLVVAPLA
ncbi:MAG: permease, partial [Anaerolineales bacterium]